jgi:membrane protein YdbS with pleckstrin-like domain
VWLIGLVVVYVQLVPEETKKQSWVLYVLAALVLLPALWVFWMILVRKLTVRYRLSTHRLFKEEGILRRSINEVELVRVDDVSVAQNLIQRVFNVGRVTVISTDATDPRTELVGIHDPIKVKELVRTHVRKWRDKSLHMEHL